MTAQSTLPLRHALLALAVMAVWGSNFVVIRSGLDHLPPLLFGFLRFALVLVPAIFFLKRPAVPWRHLAAYGVLIGAGNFGLLYIAMDGHITPGLASLVIQTQVFFTIGLAMYFTGDRMQRYQALGLALSLAGISIILAHTDTATTPLGLVLALGAAFSWASGNMVIRATPSVDMLPFVVWASLFSAPPLLLLSLVFEGWPLIRDSLAAAGPEAWAAVLWQSVANTMFGYSVWGWLLARYPAATVAPMSLLVPVFGMAASAVWLSEPLPGWKLAAAGLVLSGLALNLLWPKLRAAVRARAMPAD